MELGEGFDPFSSVQPVADWFNPPYGRLVNLRNQVPFTTGAFMPLQWALAVCSTRAVSDLEGMLSHPVLRAAFWDSVVVCVNFAKFTHTHPR